MLVDRAEADYWAGSPDSVVRRFEAKGEIAAIHKLSTEAAKLVKGQVHFLF